MVVARKKGGGSRLLYVWLIQRRVFSTLVLLLTLSVHAHEGYCSLFVYLCVCVCVSVAALVPSYDVTATNRTYQTGLR